MVDYYQNQDAGVPAGVRTKYKDMTTHHALVISTEGSTISIVSPTDDLTGAMLAIDYAHHEIHDGKFFEVSYKTPDASPLADNGTIIFALTPGAGVYPHLTAEASCGGDAQAELLEAASISSGTATTPRNHNRNGSDNSGVTVVRDPTVNSAGTLLDDVFEPGGTGPQAIGIAGGFRHEWILRPSITYLVRLTNRSGTNQPAYVAVQWYEKDSPGG